MYDGAKDLSFAFRVFRELRGCNRGLQPASEDASPRKEQDETPHFLADRCRRLLGAGAGLYEQYWLICGKLQWRGGLQVRRTSRAALSTPA